jgi:hypothetical protein
MEMAQGAAAGDLDGAGGRVFVVRGVRVYLVEDGGKLKETPFFVHKDGRERRFDVSRS